MHAARITKHGIEIFYLFWTQNMMYEKVMVMSHKNSASVVLCTVVSAGFFQFCRPTYVFDSYA